MGGFFTIENLRTVVGDNFDGVNVEQLTKEADFNGDGQISYAEFANYLTEANVGVDAQDQKKGFELTSKLFLDSGRLEKGHPTGMVAFIVTGFGATAGFGLMLLFALHRRLQVYA